MGVGQRDAPHASPALPSGAKDRGALHAGEDAEDALRAAQGLATEGLPATFTVLGENVDDLSQATAACGEYLRLLDRIDELGVDAEVSVKLTQLGFDLEPEATMLHMERLADRSEEMGRTVWIDMESSAYVDGTIDLYATLLARSPNTGLCMQAYLRRSWTTCSASLRSSRRSAW